MPSLTDESLIDSALVSHYDYARRYSPLKSVPGKLTAQQVVPKPYKEAVPKKLSRISRTNSLPTISGGQAASQCHRSPSSSERSSESTRENMSPIREAPLEVILNTASVSSPKESPNKSIPRIKSLPSNLNQKSHRSHRRSPSHSSIEMALLLSMSFDDEALEELWEDLRKRKLIFGDSHPKVGITYNLIGNCYFRRGELGAALTSYTSALEAYRSFNWKKGNTVDERPPATSHGKESGSIEDGSVSSFSSDTSNESSNYPILALCMCNIGTIHWRTGNLDEAVATLEESLRIYCRFCAKENHSPAEIPEISTAWYNLGIAYSLRAEYGEALEAFDMARMGFATSHGPCHVEVARMMEAAGNVHYLRGDIEQAMSCHQVALGMKLPELGENHPSVICSRMSIAAAHRKMQNFGDALSAYLEVLSVQRSNLSQAQQASGGNGRYERSVMADVGQTLHFLALVHEDMGDLMQTIKYCNEAMQAYTEAALEKDDSRLVKLWQKMDAISRGKIRVNR
uniref:MalT-like TPR region domain-containing protein n=1 Tax=Ditylum brightwellii TaxID=49249 RepID=A0A7S1YP40_9STRA|mmetsp:Transcript_10361/g.15300  ORF Transcript_10361/g.15300 Transcript_10361/m.15300 type:complete len:513 (+) Transcript_10361:70-1608(+)